MINQDQQKIYAYATFKGNVEGIIKSIDWIKLEPQVIKTYLQTSMKELDKELSRINSSNRLEEYNNG